MTILTAYVTLNFMKNFYEYTSPVSISSVDQNLNMRLDAIFNVMQDLTTFHSYDMGIDHDSLKSSSNAFFVLSKIKVLIKKLPYSNELVTFKTYPTEVGKIKFFREYQFSGQNGGLIYARSEWCTLDYDLKSLRQSSTIDYPKDIVHLPSNYDIARFSPILCDLSNDDFKYAYTVLSTDIDCNLHVNNVSYVKMAYNAFTPEEYADYDFKEIEINFISQAFYGDSVDVYKKEVDNKVFVFGKLKDKAIFKAVFTK